MLRKLYLILKNELFLPSSQLLIITNVLFIIFMLIIFGFVIGEGVTRTQELAIIAIWISYLINLGMILPKLFAEDFTSGRFEIFAASKLNLRIYFISKIIYTLILFLVIDLISIPIAILLFNLKGIIISDIIKSVVIASPIIAIIVTIFALMIAQNNSVNFGSSILILPLIMPIIILAIMTASNIQFAMIILIGLNLILIPASVALSSFLLKD